MADQTRGSFLWKQTEIMRRLECCGVSYTLVAVAVCCEQGVRPGVHEKWHPLCSQEERSRKRDIGLAIEPPCFPRRVHLSTHGVFDGRCVRGYTIRHEGMERKEKNWGGRAWPLRTYAELLGAIVPAFSSGLAWALGCSDARAKAVVAGGRRGVARGNDGPHDDG